MRGVFASAGVRWAAGAFAALAYASASHGLMTQAQDSGWALAIVLGPVVVLGSAWAWGTGHKLLALAGALGAVLLALCAVSDRSIPARWLYLAQHAGVHLALAAWFGSTLRPGREALVSALARRVHREFTPEMALYTRQVTLAWVLYFAGMAFASVVLFLAGEFAHWSLLANVLTPMFTAAMFVAEYLLRYRLHPGFERVSLQESVRAYRRHAAAAADRPQP